MNWPAIVGWITPPHMHISMELLFSVGMFASSTVGAPGSQGAVVAGMHGIGVSTPSAAAVAAATIGLAIDMQVPKGRMFTSGLLSMMLASGTPVITRFCGSTARLDGAAPKVHWHIAPMQAARYEADEWESTIGEFLVGRSETTVSEVARALSIETPRLGRQDQNRIMAALEILGWKRGTRTGVRRVWVRN